MKKIIIRDEREHVKFLLLALNALSLDTGVYEKLCDLVESYNYADAYLYAEENIKNRDTLAAVLYLMRISAYYTLSLARAA